MALIDIEELKTVLGIGDIYADPVVQECADAAEDVLLSYLTFNKAQITHVRIDSNVASFTAPESVFVVGQALTVSGCGSPFDGSRTVTEVWDNGFKAAITNADITLRAIVPTGSALLTSQAALYDADPATREVALSIAVDVWNSRSGNLGQQGIDYQPAPYKLSRGLLQRVIGLLGKNIDVRGMVG